MNEILREALKWAGIVLLAGFVGYFGKHLAKALIEKISKKKKEKPQKEKVIKVSSDDSKYKYKLEKKRLKLQKKKLKD
ncbi:MAG: hypothetical protein U9O94_09685 [Nanoarchaeota archaeon]|nr:hypothetical protein [Nanoarchaeota archaeon]